MKMEAQVNPEKCIGCGRCTELCADTFKLNERGKSDVIGNENIECAKKAADECPAEAISIEVEFD